MNHRSRRQNRSNWKYDQYKGRMVPLIEQRDFILEAMEAFFFRGGMITRLESCEDERYYFHTDEINEETDEFLQGR